MKKRRARGLWLTKKGYEAIGMKVIPLYNFPWYRDRRVDGEQDPAHGHPWAPVRSHVLDHPEHTMAVGLDDPGAAGLRERGEDDAQ